MSESALWDGLRDGVRDGVDGAPGDVAPTGTPGGADAVPGGTRAGPADGPRGEAAAATRMQAETGRLRACAAARLKRGDAAGAILSLARLCALAPAHVEAWHGFAFALALAGEYAAASCALRRAAALAPHRFDIARHFIDAAFEGGADHIARDVAASRLQADPADPVAVFMTALVRMQDGSISEAAELADAASLLAPGEPAPIALLGRMLVRGLDVARAREVLERAAAMAPDDWELGNDLAVALLRVYRFSDACARLEALIAQHGANDTLLCNLSNARLALGDQPGAADAAQAAIARAPHAINGQRALLNVLAYTPGVTGAALLQQARRLDRTTELAAPARWRARADPERRLRVGLLSGTLKVHPVGWLTLAGIEAIDRSTFSVVALAQHTASDWIARRFQACTEWHSIEGMDDNAVARHARALDLDILIDLGGYGDHGRMSACALRLAPVQIKWVGSQAHSTGLRAMDWFITDRWETPPGYESVYSERLLRLPDGYACYLPPPDAPEVARLPALSHGHVTFGCFNNLAKVNRALIAAWAAILQRVPTARLRLRTQQFDDPDVADMVRGRFLRHDIDPDRLDLAGSASHRALLDDYRHVDIVLDPFPYSGGLTTCEALFMGVPVLTLPGETFAGRHSASHVANIGLAADWVANDLDDYIDRAARHASDLDELAALRAGMRRRLRDSPLCDAPRFGHALGAALRDCWRAWCAMPP